MSLVSDLIVQSLSESSDGPTDRMVDTFFIQVQFKEDASKEAFVGTLLQMVQPGAGVFSDMTLERLAEGPSYIEIGAWVGDQRDALLFMALGAHHGVWEIITPMWMGFERESEEAVQMAGKGFVMISGLDREALKVGLSG